METKVKKQKGPKLEFRTDTQGNPVELAGLPSGKRWVTLRKSLGNPVDISSEIRRQIWRVSRFQASIKRRKTGQEKE
jgi:hypothetical protein